MGERYRLTSVIGTGGMGAVFRAEDLKLPGKQWAVKESVRYSHNPAGFAEEAAVLTRLEHPFLPKIVDFFAPGEKGYSYLVMDFVKGRTLQDLFREVDSFSPETAVKYAIQLCDLFAYLHTFQPKPIIYRDLKPPNVMIDEQDNVRLIDFGIARSHTIGQGADTVQLGTVGFAAPEQFRGVQTDARTDLYTLGAMLFYLLSGGGFYPTDRMGIAAYRDDLPEPLPDIIHRLLEDDPDKRYQTADEVKTALSILASDKVRLTDSGPARTSGPVSKEAPGRRLILVGSLYPGAGASFVSHALAAVLNRNGVMHAVIEPPLAEPELYSHLFGERTAPSGYRFKSERSGSGPAWKEGFTEWVPLHPLTQNSEWISDHWYRLLFAVQSPLHIVDVSGFWDHPVVAEIASQADELLVVYGPLPGKLNAVSSQAKLKKLLDLEKKGTTIRWIANRDCSFSGRNEWMAALPVKPTCRIPEFPFEKLASLQWKGRRLTDDGEMTSVLTECLAPIVHSASFLEGALSKSSHQLLGRPWFQWRKKIRQEG